MDWRCLTIGGLLWISVATPLTAADCIDVSSRKPIQLSGRLDHKIFPGPPNNEDVQKGDTAEIRLHSRTRHSALLFWR